MAPAGIDTGKRPECGLLLGETLEELQEWLSNEEPNMPDRLCEAALYWLKRARGDAPPAPAPNNVVSLTRKGVT